MRYRTYAKLGFAAALLAGSSMSLAATNLVTNGSFETPSTPSSPGYSAPPLTGSDLTGWTIDSGNVEVVTGPNYPAFDGAQALDINGTTPGAISQVISTVAGLYQLTFAYTNNTDGTGPFSASYNIGGLSGTVTASGGTTANPNWQTFSGLFTATGATTLTFADTSGAGGQGIFLDAVSVTAVPEPAAWALMIGGFGLVGGTMRRTRRAGAAATA